MLIQFDQVVVSTPQAEVLRGLSLTLAQRRVGIVGPNGRRRRAGSAWMGWIRART